jgi:leucine-zipper-like transcriptional regulator 1
VDLEGWGIYQPPFQILPSKAQKFGLLTLSQPFLADFEIICSDGRRLGCSKRVLEERWSWFKKRIDEFKKRAAGIAGAQQRRLGAGGGGGGGSVEGTIIGGDGTTNAETETIDTVNSGNTFTSSMSSINSDWRLSPRSLSLSESSPVVLAILQYFYTLSISTNLQLEIGILCRLLGFSKTYEEKNLRGLVTHALHLVLNKSPEMAGKIHQAAVWSGCAALAMRSARVVRVGFFKDM